MEISLPTDGLLFAGCEFRAPWRQNATWSGYRDSSAALGGALAPCCALPAHPSQPHISPRSCAGPRARLYVLSLPPLVPSTPPAPLALACGPVQHPPVLWPARVGRCQADPLRATWHSADLSVSTGLLLTIFGPFHLFLNLFLLFAQVLCANWELAPLRVGGLSGLPRDRFTLSPCLCILAVWFFCNVLDLDFTPQC